jgi:hypothetical protein
LSHRSGPIITKITDLGRRLPLDGTKRTPDVCAKIGAEHGAFAFLIALRCTIRVVTVSLLRDSCNWLREFVAAMAIG